MGLARGPVEGPTTYSCHRTLTGLPSGFPEGLLGHGSPHGLAHRLPEGAKKALALPGMPARGCPEVRRWQCPLMTAHRRIVTACGEKREAAQLPENDAHGEKVLKVAAQKWSVLKMRV